MRKGERCKRRGGGGGGGEEEERGRGTGKKQEEGDRESSVTVNITMSCPTSHPITLAQHQNRLCMYLPNYMPS